MKTCCQNPKETSTRSGVLVCGNCRAYLGRSQPTEYWQSVAERYAQLRPVRRDEYRTGVEYREKMRGFALAQRRGWTREQNEARSRAMKLSWQKRRAASA